jgi:hypothetical protein
MKLSTLNIFRGLTLALLAFVAVGCATFKSDHPYTPAPDEAIVIPQGARIVAFGHYPIGQFTVPNEPGKLYIWDDNDRKTALVVEAKPDSQISDLSQLSKNSLSSLDATHAYRVYFAPSAIETPTTAPGSFIAK